PIVVDPSHATGMRHLVAPVARAAVAAGADGLIVEVHNQPEKALCDGAQSLLPGQIEELGHQIVGSAQSIGRRLQPAVYIRPTAARPHAFQPSATMLMRRTVAFAPRR